MTIGLVLTTAVRSQQEMNTRKPIENKIEEKDGERVVREGEAERERQRGMSKGERERGEE